MVDAPSPRNAAAAAAGTGVVAPVVGGGSGGAVVVNGAGGGGSVLTPSELLVALHNMEDVGVKKVVEGETFT